MPAPKLSTGVLSTSYVNSLATYVDDVEGKTGLTALKTFDQTVSASTTLVDDSELLLSLAASTTYKFDAAIFVVGSGTAGDIKFAFTFPAGAELSWFGLSIVDTAATFSGDVMALSRIGATVSPTSTIGYGIETAGTGINLRGTVFMGSTAGNVTLQWAQIAASGTTTVKRSSWIEARKVV